MNTSSSPTNKSLFGWVKTLKRSALLLNESVNEISDTDVMLTESKSPTRSMLSGHATQNSVPFPSTAQDLLRPLLNHKSRLTNNVNRVRTNSALNLHNQDLRLHRDLFLQNNPLVDENSKYFGVPLADAINQASAKISILGAESSADVLQYGRIPIVVAKCGVYLKKNGLTMEGIFRVGGLSKRIKELQIIFNTAPEFGKKLDWDGYTVHDAASLLRRYLNALPEPLIPLELYEEFRDPLRQRPRIIKYMKYKAENPLKPLRQPTPISPMASDQEEMPSPQISDSQTPKAQNYLFVPANTVQSPSIAETSQPPIVSPVLTVSPAPEVAGLVSPSASRTKKVKNYKKLMRDVYGAIDEYKKLLDELPNLSKQLLFYILDLLAMVQNNSNENLMSARNLAAIFQPSILLHPNHDMDPEEYALSQLVVEFLIQYAYKLLPSEEPADPPKTDAASSAAASATVSASGLLAARLLGRQHSKSSPNQDDVDLIGYHKKANGVPLSDTEHEFATSDDEEALTAALPHSETANSALLAEQD